MSQAKTNKVLLVDEHPLFVRGLASLVGNMQDYAVIGETNNLEDAVKTAEKEKPSLAIVEINLSKGCGLDLLSVFKSRYPDMVILVLSMCDERRYSERVLRLGARGYIMKDKPAEKVAEAIQTVMAGKLYLSEPERERLFETATGEIRDEKDRAMAARRLSNREFQIFSCLGRGLGTIEIASKYNLSTKTIDTHKEHIKLKLRCNSSQELRRLAIEWVHHPGMENP
ncbi:MAG: response regulator transcription factor [Treponema sp.]|jgi:DNA-binding NarL/FixJ family response regulator|nr:response regulator transcription factor [Treponema sp.]